MERARATCTHLRLGALALPQRDGLDRLLARVGECEQLPCGVRARGQHKDQRRGGAGVSVRACQVKRRRLQQTYNQHIHPEARASASWSPCQQQAQGGPFGLV